MSEVFPATPTCSPYHGTQLPDFDSMAPHMCEPAQTPSPAARPYKQPVPPLSVRISSPFPTSPKANASYKPLHGLTFRRHTLKPCLLGHPATHTQPWLAG